MTYPDTQIRLQKCIRCGGCCLASMCFTGRQEACDRGLLASYYDHVDVCPFLAIDGLTATCQLAESHADKLAIGAGCLFGDIRAEPLINSNESS